MTGQAEYAEKIAELIELLEELAAHLRANDAEHWARWFERDKLGLERNEPNAIGHVLSAYGGMGSVNDLYFGEIGDSEEARAKAAEANQRLQTLLSKAYRLAKSLERTAGS